MKENKETKQEVTNEQLLEHLKDIEIAQSCTLNGILTLFEIIGARQDQLELSYLERRAVDSGVLAISGVIQKLHDISGLTEKSKKRHERERKEVQKELSSMFGKFMKEFKNF